MNSSSLKPNMQISADCPPPKSSSLTTPLASSPHLCGPIPGLPRALQEASVRLRRSDGKAKLTVRYRALDADGKQTFLREDSVGPEGFHRSSN